MPVTQNHLFILYSWSGMHAMTFCTIYIGSNHVVGRPSIIHDIKDKYIEVKVAFVNICTSQRSPTLQQVKDRCIDLIEGALSGIPQNSQHKGEIQMAKEMTELARIVCFRLSNWVSYDFFKKVITHFQPALKSVQERLLHYEEQLKTLLLQKLEYIAELQQR